MTRGWGRIQFISSESALNIPAEMVHYGVSKAALQGLSRGLAKVLAGSGVTVNTILPGPTRTEGAVDDDGRPGRRARRIAHRRWKPCSCTRTDRRPCCGASPRPEEVANLCVYAASPQASATTGAALRVEGGIVESIA